MVVTIIGELSGEAVHDLREEYGQLADKAGTNFAVLVDLTRAVPASPPARPVLIRLLQQEKLGVGAIYGASRVVHVMATVTLTAAGVANRFQFFRDERAARAWLNQQVSKASWL
jgi:hypothetical protein